MRLRRMRFYLCLGTGIFLLLATSNAGLEPNIAHAAIANHVVINEVHIDSVSGSGGTDDDWVELYNPTGAEVPLTGWSIQKFSSGGTSIYKQALSGSIAAGAYFLIVRDGAATAQSLKDAADLLASNSFSLAAGNIIYLVNDSNNVAPGTAGANIIDYVGFGAATYYEGTAAAPTISEAKSISRVPDGEDTDENSVDFSLLDTPTPESSGNSEGGDVGGTVLTTVTPDATPVQNITPTAADIVFQVNTDGTARVNYGLTSSYGSATGDEVVTENVTKTISLSGLECGITYHYSVYAENGPASENDSTSDAVFSTLPCGITLDSLTMTKSSAKANDQYTDGWTWEFNITIWDLSETTLKMKFAEWSGPDGLDAGANMQFSVDNGSSWIDITANDAYPSTGADISGIDESGNAGRQVVIDVRMKVPVGTPAGHYDSSYGILTE